MALGEAKGKAEGKAQTLAAMCQSAAQIVATQFPRFPNLAHLVEEALAEVTDESTLMQLFFQLLRAQTVEQVLESLPEIQQKKERPIFTWN